MSKLTMMLVGVLPLACAGPGAPAPAASAGVAAAQVDPTDYLPRSGSLAAVDEPRTAHDAVSLFEAINGGAELYIGLGFERAVLQTYEVRPGRRANLEIYEMKGEAAARALYDKKAGTGGQPVEVGQAAVFKGYYLLFRRGAFYVSVTGFDVEGTELAELLALAGLVDVRLARQ